jgi:hypothetical protein
VYQAARRKRTPPVMDPGRLRRILRCFRHRESLQDLLAFPAEYHGCTFNLGFVELDGYEHWIEMTVGVGNAGLTLWKRVVSAGGIEIIKGITIGMLSNSSHMVIVQPGGRVWLVYDFEDETGENELISYTFVSAFRGIGDIGSKFDFELGTESEEYTLVSVTDP